MHVQIRYDHCLLSKSTLSGANVGAIVVLFSCNFTALVCINLKIGRTYLYCTISSTPVHEGHDCMYY